MSNEHIGRLQKLGLAKESTAGTAVTATDWIPKVEGSFNPVTEKAKDQSAYGTIDELFDSVTTKQMTEVEMSGIVRDQFGGHFLMAALGADVVCQRLAISSPSGTLQVGETVTGGTSGATGIIALIEGTSYILVKTVAGTFQAAETITGTTSSATATIGVESLLRTHLFSRLNNNTHPTYTLYGKDDVGDHRSAYCMLASLELSVAVGEFVQFSTKWKGKKEETATSTPSYTTSENRFLAKHANLYLASSLSGLAGASAVPIESLKITVEKNLEDYQAWGSDDIASIHNKSFRVYGEITALFNSETLKDLVQDSTKRAMRVKIVNTDSTIGTAGNPELIIDLAQCSFENWARQGGNDDLVRQTLGFEMEFSVTDSEGIHILLQNTKTTTY